MGEGCGREAKAGIEEERGRRSEISACHYRRDMWEMRISRGKSEEQTPEMRGGLVDYSQLFLEVNFKILD